MKTFYTLVTLLLLLTNTNVPTLQASPKSQLAESSILRAGLEEHATYQVTFTSSWSEATHPGFPAGAHFSPLIGATHNLSTTFWMSGTLASSGIEQMAETGATSLLREEIDNAGVAVLETISGSGLGTSPGEVTIPLIHVSQEHPLATLVTMIAPSPDWFVGVHNLSLLDEQGNWQDSLVITLYPYDAGSDDGADYAAPNVEANPHQPINSLRGQHPFSAEPIGTLTFTRVRMIHLPLISR